MKIIDFPQRYLFTPTESKNCTEKLYFGYISINIDFYVNIPLIKVKEHEILHKMVSFILVLRSILIETIAKKYAKIKNFYTSSKFLHDF